MIRLVNAKVIALGPFNPFIITPGWLHDWNVIADVAGAADDPADEDAADKMAFSTSDLEWQVDGQSLSVESESRERDCGKYLAAVIELLPHTPVRAVVHEFYYAASKSEWGGGPLPQIGAQPPWALEGEGIDAVRWAGTFRRGDARAEMMLEADLKRDDMIGAYLSYYRRIRIAKATVAVKAAAAATGSFFQDRDDAAKLFKALFGQEVTK